MPCELQENIDLDNENRRELEDSQGRPRLVFQCEISFANGVYIYTVYVVSLYKYINDFDFLLYNA